MAYLLNKSLPIQKLAFHGLWGGGLSPSTTYAIFAPLLLDLDIRWSSSQMKSLTSLDVPALRTLAVDGRFLHKLTSASLSELSYLNLRIAGFGPTSSRDAELRYIDRVKSHQGKMKLDIGWHFADEMLSLLSEDFIWPGLEAVDITLFTRPLRLLVGIIAARIAGAHGASKQRYLETVREAGTRLLSKRLEGEDAAPHIFMRHARLMFAAAAAHRSEAGAPPLCSQVRWTIRAPFVLDPNVLEWLNEQPNIEVREWSPER